MKGLWIESGQAVFRDDLPAPEAREGESRVRVRVAGVCATDLALRRGYMGFRGVPGHEFVGEALDGPLQGRRVVGDINASCGCCEDCTERDGHHCAERTVLGILGRSGAFAEELSLPTRNLIPVPDSVSDDQAVFTEPLAAAFEIPNQVGDVSGVSALVAGDGRLGLLCAQVLALRGARVTVAGRHSDRQGLLPEGAVHVTGLLERPAGERVFDLAVEATGHADVLPNVIARVRPRGTIVLKTTTEKPVAMDLAPIVVDEITIVGSRCGPFDVALSALEAGSIDPRPMIVDRYSLGSADRALARAAEPGVLKVLVDGS